MFTTESSVHKVFRVLTFRLLAFLENNNNINLTTNGEAAFLTHLFRYWEENEQRQLCLFDVGANVGNYTALLWERCRFSPDTEIHLFEPAQSAFEKCSDRFSDNRQIVLNRLGASDRTGATVIYYDAAASGLASLYQRDLRSYGVELDHSELVELIRLDKYIQTQRIQHIHFIKMDVEGHELAALEGMGTYLSAEFVDFIQFEYGGTNLDSHTSLRDFYTMLTRKGFVVAKVMPKGLEINDYKPRMDTFQYSNYVAISSRIVQQLR